VIIRQAYISPAISFFEGEIRKRYKFVPYINSNKPAIFYGCYSPKKYRSGRRRPDVSTVEAHKSLGIIVWCGSDALVAHLPPYKKIRSASNLRHIAVSRSVSEDLLHLGIPHTYVPLCSVNTHIYHNYNIPLGLKVYVYTSFNIPEVYGFDLVKQVQAKLPDVEFMVHAALPPYSIPRAKMPRAYGECFIGLRLTTHDGLSNTVVELGMMGRRCVWNGWMPNAIPWTSVDDVVRIIKEEQSRIGELHPEVKEVVCKYLRVGRDWLHPKFYE